MSEVPEFIDQNDPVFDDGGEMSMVETWIAAFTKPNEATFIEIAAQKSASLGKAFLWAFLAMLMTSFGSLIGQAFATSNPMGELADVLPPEFAEIFSAGSGAAIGFGTIICGAPIMAIIGVISFAISVAFVQWIAKLFGGTGSYEKLAYAFSAILVPYSVIAAILAILGAIPFVGILTGAVNLGLSIYILVLEVQAVKGVNGIDTGKSIASILLPGLVIFVFVCCCVIAVTMALGPVIGEVFNEIGQGIY
ncbi:MAG: YIP1 family protein [Anaerolineae bacterium]|jgi:hypothetical protein|nr:YIP1 family protein [Anaerolineae bacterium]MBT7783032.1 YIP1 family protein [Anaerolineae bacterium]